MENTSVAVWVTLSIYSPSIHYNPGKAFAEGRDDGKRHDDYKYIISGAEFSRKIHTDDRNEISRSTRRKVPMSTPCLYFLWNCDILLL